MNAKQIECTFATMGARFKVSVVPAQRVSNDYAVDIQQDRRGEFFELRVPEFLRDSLDVNVLQASSVVQAKEALKPLAIRARQSQLKVPARLPNRRKRNTGVVE